MVASRQILVQGMNVVGMAVLAKQMGPTRYGVLVSMSVLVQLAYALLGSSFASCLMLEKDNSREQESGVFTFQLLLAGIIFGVIASISFMVSTEFRTSLLALSVAFLLLPFSSISQVRREKKLRFGRPAISDIVQALTFNGVAIILVRLGVGFEGCAAAYLLRFIAATLILGERRSASWADMVSCRQLLKSGFYLQASTTVSVVKDAVNPVLLGYLVGASAVGYLNWANMIAAYPCMFLFLLAKIYMPMFSHLRFNGDAIDSAVNTILQLTNTFVAATAFPTLLLIQPITALFFGEEWRSATGLFYYFWVANFFVASVTPLLALLNAYGRQRFVFLMCLCWMLSTWCLAIPLCSLYGATGLAIANLMTQLTNYFVFAQCGQIARIDYRRLIVLWAAVGAAQIGLFEILPERYYSSQPGLLLVMGALVLAGFAVSLLIVNRHLVSFVRQNAHPFRSN